MEAKDEPPELPADATVGLVAEATHEIIEKTEITENVEDLASIEDTPTGLAKDESLEMETENEVLAETCRGNLQLTKPKKNLLKRHMSRRWNQRTWMKNRLLYFQ